jgi:hypothetical protein
VRAVVPLVLCVSFILCHVNLLLLLLSLRRIVLRHNCFYVDRYRFVFIRAFFLVAHSVIIVSCFCERAFGATVASSVLAVVPLVLCVSFILCHVNLLLSSLAACVFAK